MPNRLEGSVQYPRHLATEGGKSQSKQGRLRAPFTLRKLNLSAFVCKRDESSLLAILQPHIEAVVSSRTLKLLFL